MAENKASLTHELQCVKRKSGKSYSQIAKETGLTNVYVAQLLRRQAQLKPETAPKLRAALPDLPENLIVEMMTPPLRSYDPHLIQDPTIYRQVFFFHDFNSFFKLINSGFGVLITILGGFYIYVYCYLFPSMHSRLSEGSSCCYQVLVFLCQNGNMIKAKL